MDRLEFFLEVKNIIDGMTITEAQEYGLAEFGDQKTAIEAIRNMQYHINQLIDSYK